MKPGVSLPKLSFIASTIFLMMPFSMLRAQLCSNPKDSVYGLSTNGQFHSINVNNATASSAILGGAAVSNAVNSNGLGFSQLTGKFYFFNRVANSDFNEFVSYNPTTGLKAVLANPPAPLTTGSGDKIRSGSVTNDGTGFYTILPSNPGTAATLYYYNIPLNTWKIISQSFKDTATAASLDSQFHNLNSGDMTFDGAGNLWIIASKSPKYAVYKVSAPVTTNAVAKLAVTVVIPTRNMPRAASVASFTGIAFNSTGSLYMTTGSNSVLASGADSGPGDYNLLYRMTNVSPIVIDSIGRLPNSYGDDLTSCIYPVAVLQTAWISFDAVLKNNSALLTWTINEDDNVSGYNIQSSNDGEQWRTIGHINSYRSIGQSLNTYEYRVNDLNQGVNYYRIAKIEFSGKQTTSSIRVINTGMGNNIFIAPNPVKDMIHLYNKNGSSRFLAQIYDRSGSLVYSGLIGNDQQSINISHLPKGSYILKLMSSSTNDVKNLSFIKL